MYLRFDTITSAFLTWGNAGKATESLLVNKKLSISYKDTKGETYIITFTYLEGKVYAGDEKLVFRDLNQFWKWYKGFTNYLWANEVPYTLGLNRTTKGFVPTFTHHYLRLMSLPYEDTLKAFFKYAWKHRTFEERHEFVIHWIKEWEGIWKLDEYDTSFYFDGCPTWEELMEDVTV